MMLASSDCRLESVRKERQQGATIQGKSVLYGCGIPQVKVAPRYLWQHRRIRYHGVGKQTDWWPGLAVMQCRWLGQSVLGKGVFSSLG